MRGRIPPGLAAIEMTSAPPSGPEFERLSVPGPRETPEVAQGNSAQAMRDGRAEGGGGRGPKAVGFWSCWKSCLQTTKVLEEGPIPIY